MIFSTGLIYSLPIRSPEQKKGEQPVEHKIALTIASVCKSTDVHSLTLVHFSLSREFHSRFTQVNSSFPQVHNSFPQLMFLSVDNFRFHLAFTEVIAFSNLSLTYVVTFANYLCVS